MSNTKNAKSKLIEFLRSSDHSEEVRLLGVLLANFVEEELADLREEVEHELHDLSSVKEDA